MPSPSTTTEMNVLIDALNRWIAAVAMDIGSISAMRKISIGQSNPTYQISCDQGRYILRMQPPGDLLPSAHAVDREFCVMQALAVSQVPVPKMIALCTDLDVIGVKFFIMEEMTGTTFMNPALPEFNSDTRKHLYDAQIDVLAALASTKPDALGLGDFGRPSGYLDRQIALWTKQYRNSETDLLDDMEYLIETLPGSFDDSEVGLCVVHGDFRLDNLIIQDSPNPSIQALIDWELSTLGPCFVDLSYCSAMLRMPSDWVIGGLGGVDRTALGIPSEDELVSRFCAQTGLQKPDNWEVWIAFQLFRFAAILQGVKKRHLDGNASASNAEEVGRQTIPVAALAAATLKAFLSQQ